MNVFSSKHFSVFSLIFSFNQFSLANFAVKTEVIKGSKNTHFLTLEKGFGWLLSLC